VIIKIERSGGIAGMQTSTEMDSKDLPSILVSKVRNILENVNSSTPTLKMTPKPAADHYNYKISVQDGRFKKELECNEYNIPHDLKLLVKYIEKSSKPNIL
jgi:hypothetical protein